MNIREMRMAMSDIVQKCIEKHGGGEAYFDELDGMVKENEELLASYIDYVASFNPNSFIIMSGEIGQKCLEMQRSSKIPMGLRIYVVDGGLRKSSYIKGMVSNRKEMIKAGKNFVFVDDSFYSGKTFNAVREFMEKLGYSISVIYVFYDGCKHDFGVKSLYRYYAQGEVRSMGILEAEYYANHKQVRPEWNVFTYNGHLGEIAEINIFKHFRFGKDVVKLLESDMQRDEFDERLENTLRYYFWQKSEYEILIYSLFGDGREKIKADIYRQVTMNFDRFSEYLWGLKEDLKGK